MTLPPNPSRRETRNQRGGAPNHRPNREGSAASGKAASGKAAPGKPRYAGGMSTVGWGTVVVALLAGSLTASACGHRQEPEPVVVPQVDLRRYAGLWYEIASIPISEQEDCVGTTAHYGLAEDGQIEVVNECRDADDGELRRATGKAWIDDPEQPAKLQVQFFWPFHGDYWILALDPDYEWALVGTPDREHAWILARTPRLNEALIARLVERLRQDDYPVERLRRTPHTSSEG